MEFKVGGDGKPIAYLSPPGSPSAPAAITVEPQPHPQPGMEANVSGPGETPFCPGMQVMRHISACKLSYPGMQVKAIKD